MDESLAGLKNQRKDSMVTQKQESKPIEAGCNDPKVENKGLVTYIRKAEKRQQKGTGEHCSQDERTAKSSLRK